MFKAILTGLYLASIVAGVFAIDALGVVPIPGGFMAPAAVYVVGVTLVLRDLLHEAAGRGVAFLAVMAGAGLSALVNPGLALASGVAFLVSETLDLAVYEKVRDRFSSSPLGMIFSNAISIPVDSLIFLGLAFGSLAFLPGQIVGKAIASALAIAVLVTIGTIAQLRLQRKAQKAVAAEEARRDGLSYVERRMEDLRAARGA